MASSYVASASQPTLSAHKPVQNDGRKDEELVKLINEWKTNATTERAWFRIQRLGINSKLKKPSEFKPEDFFPKIPDKFREQLSRESTVTDQINPLKRKSLSKRRLDEGFENTRAISADKSIPSKDANSTPTKTDRASNQSINRSRTHSAPRTPLLTIQANTTSANTFSSPSNRSRSTTVYDFENPITKSASKPTTSPNVSKRQQDLPRRATRSTSAASPVNESVKNQPEIVTTEPKLPAVNKQPTVNTNEQVEPVFHHDQDVPYSGDDVFVQPKVPSPHTSTTASTSQQQQNNTSHLSIFSQTSRRSSSQPMRDEIDVSLTRPASSTSFATKSAKQPSHIINKWLATHKLDESNTSKDEAELLASQGNTFLRKPVSSNSTYNRTAANATVNNSTTASCASVLMSNKPPPRIGRPPKKLAQPLSPTSTGITEHATTRTVQQQKQQTITNKQTQIVEETSTRPSRKQPQPPSPTPVSPSIRKEQSGIKPTASKRVRVADEVVERASSLSATAATKPSAKKSTKSVKIRDEPVQTVETHVQVDEAESGIGMRKSSRMKCDRRDQKARYEWTEMTDFEGKTIMVECVVGVSKKRDDFDTFIRSENAKRKCNATKKNHNPRSGPEKVRSASRSASPVKKSRSKVKKVADINNNIPPTPIEQIDPDQINQDDNDRGSKRARKTSRSASPVKKARTKSTKEPEINNPPAEQFYPDPPTEQIYPDNVNLDGSDRGKKRVRSATRSASPVKKSRTKSTKSADSNQVNPPTEQNSLDDINLGGDVQLNVSEECIYLNDWAVDAATGSELPAGPAAFFYCFGKLNPEREYVKLFDGVYVSRITNNQGVLKIEPLCSTRTIQHDDAQVTYSVQQGGSCAFSINGLISSHVIGDLVFVPRGLDYKIKNRSNTQNAYLFFSK